MICNTGVSLDPTVDGQLHHFAAQGLYDGLFLAVDRETGTSWNHITGRALHGPLVGHTLEVRNVRQTTVAQALAADAETRVAISGRPFRRGEPGFFDRIRGLSPFFQETIATEDDRLETMTIGLGAWSDETKRFYPMETVRDAGAVLDDFGGRRLLVFYDPAGYALTAQYTEADEASWNGDVLELSDGGRIEAGVTYDASGRPVEPERPLQVFTRWYGFSLTFEEPEIYEGG